MKRFTSDLLKVLKSQSAKQVYTVIGTNFACLTAIATCFHATFQVSLLDLPTVFEKVLNRQFKITDYGVSF